MNTKRLHTTIGLKKTTKSRLDEKRAPGQCYDGFLCQMLDLWETTGNDSKITRKMPRRYYKEVAP